MVRAAALRLRAHACATVDGLSPTCRASARRPIADEREKEHRMKNIMTTGLRDGRSCRHGRAPANSHDKHAHETWSAGEPGDPKKPSRTMKSR